MKRVLGRSAGFTMTELLVSTIISLLLGVAGFSFFRSQARSLTDQAASLDAIEGARAALEFIASDIRNAGLKPTGSCSTCGTGLSGASATALTVGWDANSSGTLDGGESITYSYESATKTIVRTVSGASAQTLIKNVPSGGLSFQYLTSAGSAATISGGVPTNAVTIVLTIQVEAAKATTVTTTSLSSRIALRNTSTVLGRL
jgi:Tfp pilus assembly protein PilW